MTAPTPALLPRTTAPDRTRDAARAAAANGPRASETRGFAAHLAREASPPDEAPVAQPPLRDSCAQPRGSAQTAADAPEPVAEPGKTLPPARQKPAGQPAALHAFAIAAALIGAEGAPENAAADPAAKPADAAPEAALAAIPVPLPGSALLPLPAPTAPAAAAPTGTTPAATAAAPALPAAPPRPAEAAAPAAQTAKTADFAIANLVLEREAAIPAADPALQPATPDQAAPEAATQSAARAQPSTLAALTGAPERPATRKLRNEAELALPTAKALPLPAPETAGALAFAQPASAPANAAEAPAASAPQPLSFDQLVDSIARARDGLEPAGPVSVALRHAEFGRISLRIEGDAAGLSVAMASPDPAFAPAVAAAHAAAVSAEPDRAASADARADLPGQNLNQGQPGTGQQRQNAHAPTAQRPAVNPARAPAAVAERRSGIFA